mgnify:CR=1 FL=1
MSCNQACTFTLGRQSGGPKNSNYFLPAVKGPTFMANVSVFSKNPYIFFSVCDHDLVWLLNLPLF